MKNTLRALVTTVLVGGGLLGTLAACNTAPSAEDRASFQVEAGASRDRFVRETSGLREQLLSSAGYLVFPGVGQWGLIFGGGTFGRAVVYSAAGNQEGWASVSNPSFGLQLGGQGLQMLIAFENSDVFSKFKENVLSGSAGATAVGGEAGAAAVAPYTNGVAVYVTGQKGLMAGASVGLQYLRFEKLEAAAVP